MKTKCTCCQNPVELNEIVFLDSLNGITHASCEEQMELPIKDQGPFWAIIQKYDFFHEVIDNYLFTRKL